MKRFDALHEARKVAERHCPVCSTCKAIAQIDEFGYWCRNCYRPTTNKGPGSGDIVCTEKVMHAPHVYQAMCALWKEFGKDDQEWLRTQARKSGSRS